MNLELQGIKTASQVSTPCYTAKPESVEYEEENQSQTSPTPTDFEQLEHSHQLNTIYKKKRFTPNMRILSDEFESKENRVKRELCRKTTSREEKIEVLTRWKDFMEEISAELPFFEYFENHFQWHKKSVFLEKTNWTKENREVFQSSHPPQETITIKHQNVKVVASPFKISTDEEKPVRKVIEQNNYTNQCLDVLGKQLDRIENKANIQPSSLV